MNQIIRKIAGGFSANFQLVQNSLVINITHPLKSQIYFSRISDMNMPKHLIGISDNTKELYEFITDMNPEKITMSAVEIGRRVKEYSIPLEKADISYEEALKKKVEDLEKLLYQKEFQARFYKEQYFFLLQHLQLQPDTEQLQRIYKRNVADIFENEAKMGKSQSMQEKSESFISSSTMSSISNRSAKVGSARQIEKPVLKCPKSHILQGQETPHPYFKCNICRKNIGTGQMKFNCRPCDFDACSTCISTPPQMRKYCPKQHAVTFGVAKNYLVRSCDVCRKTLAFSKGFTCLQCDYDICQECLK